MENFGENGYPLLKDEIKKMLIIVLDKLQEKKYSPSELFYLRRSLEEDFDRFLISFSLSSLVERLSLMYYSLERLKNEIRLAHSEFLEFASLLEEVFHL